MWQRLGKRLIHNTYRQKKTQLKRSKDIVFKNKLGDRRLNFLLTRKSESVPVARVGEVGVWDIYCS
jgi:hypothetical protein